MRRRGGLLRGVAPALLLAVTFAAGPARGATPRTWAQGPDIRAEVDTTVITVGDRITLTISVDHPAGSRVDWPDSLDLTPFEVLDARAEAPAEAADGAPSSLVLTLTAFEVGELEIPGIPVEVVGPGEERTTLRTSRFHIRVRSVGLDEGGDIREIKGPLSIPRNLLGILLWGLGLLAAVSLGWFLFRRIARGGGPEDAVPALPSRPPHEVALEALARLEASPLLERGEVKEYHIRASEILRVYVEGRFRVPALEMTTLDLTRGMARVGVDPPLLEEFRQYLHRCDMVKFAKDRPGMEASGALLALGRRLVEATVPVVEAPAEEAPADPSGEED
jgi:hypothetical protein